MTTTTSEITTTINDLADAYSVTDPGAERSDHLKCLLQAATKLGISANAATVVTDAQAEALDEWMSQI